MKTRLSCLEGQTREERDAPKHWVPIRQELGHSCILSSVSAVRSQNGSSRDPSSRLEFPLHLPPRQPDQDSLRVRFLFAVYIAWLLLLVALSSSVRNLVVPDRVRSLWWNMDKKLGGSQLRAEPVGRLSRARTSQCQTFSPSRVIRRVTTVGTSRLSRNTSPAMSRRSSVVSWRDSPRDEAVPKSEDAVMEDCTESHQAEINRKIRANDKLRKILTNMPDEHKSLISGNSLKAKMQSLDDEKAALLAAKRQFLPLQSRIEKQKNYLERISREIETEQQHRLEIFFPNWNWANQELDAAHAKQVQTKHEMSALVAEQTAENAKAVNQGTSGIQSLSPPSNPDPDAQQTILSVFKSVLSMKNMRCHSVAEQLMAAGATDEEVKKISQIMAQTVRKLEGGSTIPEPGIEVLKPACDVLVLDAELPSCIPGFSSVDSHQEGFV